MRYYNSTIIVKGFVSHLQTFTYVVISEDVGRR